MEEGMVPVEKGMRITRHMDMKSYTKYNACLPNSEQRACQDLNSRDLVLVKGKPMNYQDLVIDQNLKIKTKQENLVFYLFGFFRLDQEAWLCILWKGGDVLDLCI
jgi:hypothetical protein